MKNQFQHLLVISCLVLTSCATDEVKAEKSAIQAISMYQESDQLEEKTASANFKSYTNEETSKPTKKDKKPIKKGSMEIKSKHLSKSKSAIDKALFAVDGYYDQENFTKSGYEQRYSLEIRIPASQFQNFVNNLSSGSDEIVAKNISTSDVSEEYYDAETRLNSKREYLKRYQEIMRNAKNVDELLKIEAEIRTLIEEIESTEGRLRYLNDQVGFSTLNIELYKTFTSKQAVAEPGFFNNAGDSIETGWDSIVNFVLGVLKIWPIILVLSFIGYFVRKRVKILFGKQKTVSK